MCGIVGYVGDKSAVGIIVEGLKRLEYRGYDSAGVAVLHEGRLEVRRAAGRIRTLEGILRERPVAGSLGIGHTRWATHGRPSDENAPPTPTAAGTWSSSTTASSRTTSRSRSGSPPRATRSGRRPTPRSSRT